MSQAVETIWTKEIIAANMEKSDHWLIRGLLAIYAKQTKSEQASQQTKEYNKVGFNGRDAEFCSSLAEQVNAGRTLSVKQISCLRKVMKKYAGQLAKIANKLI